MRRLRFLFVFFILFGLISCQTDQDIFQVIEKDLVLDLSANDTLNSVTKDINLPFYGQDIKDLSIEWQSSDQTHARIEDGKIIITRPILMDANVTITALVTYKKDVKNFEFDLVVKKVEDLVTTHLVTIYDGETNEVFTINHNANFNEDHPVKEGYTFGGYYTDQSFENAWVNTPITSDLTLYIKWVEGVNLDLIAPEIIGARDIYYTIGDTIDYLYGIQAVDNVDPNPVLSFDDSLIEFDIPGTYILYIIATDASNNEKTVEVNFIIEQEEMLASYKETFDNIPDTGSSYTNGTFTGVAGIVWTYSGMRTDEVVDGKSLTFGRGQDYSLKANFTGGASKISVDLKHAYSGSTTRNVGLYINNVLVHTFEVMSSKLNYEVSDLNISGNFSLELRNLGGERVSVDNLTIYNDQLSQDVKDIDSDSKNFFLPTRIIENTVITLLTIGPKGSTISYEFNNLQDPNNQYINLNSGEVTVPVDAQVSITLKVIFSKGSDSKTITKTIVLGEGEPITIAEANQQIGSVKTRGVLTGFVVEGSFIRGFIQDNSGAIEVRFNLNQENELQVGMAYVIKGKANKTTYAYIDTITSLEQKGVETFTAVSVHKDTLNDYLSSYIYLEGILQRHYASQDAYIYTESGIVLVEVKDTYNPFINQKIGQKVTLTGHVVLVNSTYKIIVTDGYDVEVSLFNETLFKAYLLEDLNLDEEITTGSDIILKTISTTFNLSILWSSSNQSVLSSSGKVTTPSENTDVTLTYIASLGSELIYTGTIEVTVTSGFNVSGYYQDASGKQGTALLAELTSIISRNYNGISYKSTNRVLEVADKHPSGNGYLGIYDHVSITSYNKEHVWPQSSFSEASPYVSDMHHLRISNSNTNSTRSNYYFNNPLNNTTKWEVGSSRFFPGDLDKGDVARMLMYMAVRYRNDNFKLIVAQSGRTSNDPKRTMGNLAVLYQWHLDDPVDDFERNRNQVIYETQNNRNPFIDHPEFFQGIWQIFMDEDQNKKASSAPVDVELTSSFEFELDFVVVATIPESRLTEKRYFA